MRRAWGLALSRVAYVHLYMPPCRREHVDQRIDREEVDAAAHEVGYPRLRDTEELRCLALADTLLGDVLPECQHEGGANLHVFGLSGGALNGIPDAVETLTHGFAPFAALCSGVMRSRYRHRWSSESSFENSAG